MEDKIGILPKTIDSLIIIDGLKSLSNLEGFPESKGLSLVVGGTAVQSYLPAEYRRPTSDIDILVVKPLNYEEFKQLVSPIVKYLKDCDYKTETKKSNTNFKVCVSNKDNTDGLVIEFSRRNQKKFEEQVLRLGRELKNGRKKTIYGTDTNYLVASPEDIILPKIVRGIGTLKRFPFLEPELAQIYKKEADLAEIIRYVIGERAVANSSGSPEMYDQSKLKADLYDIICLSKFAGFNEDYLKTSAGDWGKTSQPSEQQIYLNSLLNLSLSI